MRGWMWGLGLCAVLLAGVLACGKGAGEGNASTSDAARPPPSTLSEAFQRLRESGDIPALDYGEDVAGPDVDHNGVRDDIDAYIAKQPYTPQQRAAVLRYARALRDVLTVGATNPALRSLPALKAGAESGWAVDCLWMVFPERDISSDMHPYNLGATYEKIMANTLSRVRAYALYSAALDGTGSMAPKERRCD